MHIEELPDDFDEPSVVAPGSSGDAPSQGHPPADLLTQAMNHFGDASQVHSDGVPGPVPPPAMAAMRNKSADEILAELNKSPLFMTELEENDDLEAFKALAYEGTPGEVAQNFKEQGNDCFKSRSWVDAKEFYGKAVQVLQMEDRKRRKIETFTKSENPNADAAPSSDPDEIKKEQDLLEACLVNRAACHLELQNYRACTLDCAAALRINARNVKAYYRSSRALLALSKIDAADDACARGLALDPSNAALATTAAQIAARAATLSARQKRDAAREARARREALTLRAALRARGIRTRETPQPPEMEDARVALVPDPADPASALSFPTVLLYPRRLQSDFVKGFVETECVAQHLAYVLPPPWDTEGVYTPQGVECYMETADGGGLLKLGKKVPLLKVLVGGKVVVVDEVLRIFVVPKGEAEAWVREFKSKRAIELGKK